MMVMFLFYRHGINIPCQTNSINVLKEPTASYTEWINELKALDETVSNVPTLQYLPVVYISYCRQFITVITEKT